MGGMKTLLLTLFILLFVFLFLGSNPDNVGPEWSGETKNEGR